MAKLIVQVRTNDNLLQILSKNQSEAWVIAKGKENDITHVQIVNFAGTQMIEGVFDRNESYRDINNNDRLVLRFLDGHIVNCSVTFNGQNPVTYLP